MANMHKRAKGNMGEDIACTYIESRGFKVISRNYLRKWGEVDIVALKDKDVHFFEVKSVMADFSNRPNSHKPEDNVHGLKVKRIRRMIETFLEDTDRGLSAEFQFHIITVYMNEKTRRARVQMM